MELIQKLPNDIIRRIIPYTYHVQPKILLEDIENYHQSYHMLIQGYRETFSEFPCDRCGHPCFNWIINDIFGWLNNNMPTGRWGVVSGVPHFYSVWSRFTTFRPFDLEQMNSHFQLFEKKSNETQVRVFWALLTPYERNLFIDNL